MEGAIRGLGPGTWVAADARQGHGRVLPAPGIAEHAATSAGRQRDGGPGMVNALHQRPPIFPAGFHGVSTKRLDRCPSWLMWLERARRSDADRLRTLSGQAAAGSYENTRRQMADRPQPFWDYWEKQTATSMLV